MVDGRKDGGLFFALMVVGCVVVFGGAVETDRMGCMTCNHDFAVSHERERMLEVTCKPHVQEAWLFDVAESLEWTDQSNGVLLAR